MATYKVYRKGNFLEVVDLDNGQVWNAPVYDAFIEKLHDPLQYRYRFHFSDGKFLDRILLEEIVDENSAPYTAQSFDTFRTCKLGYVPIGFGCGESINIPQDFLDLTDTPDSYSGAANQYVRVNATATGLEFFALDLSIYAEIANLGATAFSNDYNDLDNLPVVSSLNFANTDLTFTANRTHDFDGYSLNFIDGKFGFNGTNANSQFNINNSLYAWGFSVFQNKPFEDAIYISALSGRAGYFISNSAVGVEAINETGANYAINALGKYDGTGKALKTFGEVRMDGLNTYADNATAVVALGTNRLYYRTGHGLDITV